MTALLLVLTLRQVDAVPEPPPPPPATAPETMETAPRRPLPHGEPAPAADTSVPEQLQAPAPRWPGALAMLLAGTELTVETGYGVGAFFDTAFCSLCGRGRDVSRTNSNINISYLVGGGILTMLAGMAWLAWTQPPDASWPRAPGYASLFSGIVQLGGGLLSTLLASSVEPFRRQDLRSAGFVIGSGAVALAAGVVWLAWAYSH